VYIIFPKWCRHYSIRAILCAHKPFFLLPIILSGLDAYAQFPGKVIETDRTDTIVAGVLGSINMLTDNTEVLTGKIVLDDSLPKSRSLFGSGTSIIEKGNLLLDASAGLAINRNTTSK
jgi:hypothetical protein